MVKVFISQPMNGKTEDYIKREREHLIEVAKGEYGDVEILDSFITNAPSNANALWYLGKSIEILSQADVLVLAEDWKQFRGCRIEKACALQYGLNIIEIVERYLDLESVVK